LTTDAGDVCVEDLRIGDRLLTLEGTYEPIKWIAWRSYRNVCPDHGRAILPFVVKAGALGEGVPTRDLYVSNRHGFFLSGVLVPAECLVNGSSIAVVDDRSSVKYFNFELDRHAVMFAEGAAVETFRDDNSRQLAENAAEFHALYPDFDPSGVVPYAPTIESGAILEDIRASIAQRCAACEPIVSLRVPCLDSQAACDSKRPEQLPREARMAMLHREREDVVARAQRLLRRAAAQQPVTPL